MTEPLAPYFVGQVVGYAERLRQAARQTDIELRWYILFTEPGREWVAHEWLEDKAGFDPYVPMFQMTTRRAVNTMFGTQHREQSLWRPIFPGYLFMPLNMAWSFGPIDHAPGIRRDVNGNPFLLVDGPEGEGRKPAVLRDADIAMLRKIEFVLQNPDIPGVPFNVGDQVRIMEGPFADITAEISRMDDANRIELLMDLLGQRTKVFAAARQIEPI